MGTTRQTKGASALTGFASIIEPETYEPNDEVFL